MGNVALRRRRFPLTDPLYINCSSYLCVQFHPLHPSAHLCRRFLSIEPLIGPLGELELKGIDWVIEGVAPPRIFKYPDGPKTRSIVRIDFCLPHLIRL